MTNVNWTEAGKKTNNYNPENFLKVSPGCNLRIRLIGSPVQVVRLFTTDKKCIIVDSEDIGNKVKQKYPDKIDNISIRYSCKCIDRSDNILKILDMPKTVAQAFGSRAENIEKSISSRTQGCDWIVRTNGQSGFNCRYEVVYIEETPLTDSEFDMVKEIKEQDTLNLQKMYKSKSLAEIDEMLNVEKDMDFS